MKTKMINSYGKKPEYTVACCRDEGQMGDGARIPSKVFFRGCPAASYGVLHFESVGGELHP